VELHLSGRWLSGPSDKFLVNSSKLTCLEITCHKIKYSTALWLLELRRGSQTGLFLLTVFLSLLTRGNRLDVSVALCVIRVYVHPYEKGLG
jgi:hypothetical protein